MREHFMRELAPLRGEEEASALFEVAASYYLGYTRLELRTRQHDRLNQSDLLKLYQCCEALCAGSPIQYVTGEAAFYGLRLSVSPDVLIPRPETEELVHLMLKRHNASARRVLDIGTGSGCIALALKKSRPAWTITAGDVSTSALSVAKTNAEKLKLEINLRALDILQPSHEITSDEYEIIVSNPPYIPDASRHSIAKHVTDHEPHLALFSPGDALLFYRAILGYSRTALRPGGYLYFELASETANEVRALAEDAATFESVELIKDMSSNLRFLACRRQPD